MKPMKYALAGAGMLLSAIAAQAETLTLSAPFGLNHPITTTMIKPWIEQVEAATNGELKIRILPKPVGAPPAHFDIAKDGLADITYGIHGYQPGRFVLTSVAELPFLGDKAEDISAAYWDVYQKYGADSGEHEGVKLLGLFTHGPGTMMTTGDVIDEVADLSGMKIRIGGGVVQKMSNALGVVGLFKPAGETYEILSRGVADGVFFPIEAIAAFKLEKVVKNVTTFPGGFYNVSFFFVMNEGKYNGLSDEHRAAIDAASGAAFSRMAGAAFDASDDRGRALASEAGVNVVVASDAMQAEVKSIVDPIEADWIAAATEKGVDGAAMAAELRAAIAASQSN